MPATTENILTMTAPVAIQAAAKKSPRVRIVAYTGGIMRPAGWGNVAINLAGLDFRDNIPLLVDHDDALAAVIGSGKPTVTDGQLVIVGTLTETDVAKHVVALIGGGVELQASVGVSPTKTRFVRGGEKLNINGKAITTPEAGVTLIEAGQLKEVSVVVLGADDATRVSIAARNAAGGKTEVEPNTAVRTERERIQAILARAEKFPSIARAAIDEGWTIERVEMECLRAERDAAELRALRNSRPGAPAIHGGGSPADVSHRDVLAAGFLILAGRGDLAEKSIGAPAANRAADLRCRTIRDLLTSGLRMVGRDTPKTDSELIRAYVSTQDLSNALGLAGDKIALDFYVRTPATWTNFCGIVSVNNFREHTQIRVNHLGQFEQVAPGGELKHGVLTESTFPIKADTLGKIFGLTRKDIINDDLGFFTKIAEALGRMSAQAISNAVWRIVLENADDFFGDGHGNLIEGIDSALSVVSLSDAITKMRKQTDPAGHAIDIAPTSLIVPPELEPTARQILRSTQLARDVSDSDQLPQGNPIPELQLGVEPRISNANFIGNSSKKWFLFGSPADACVTVAFLNGQRNPIIESVDPPPDVLGIMFRGFHDFGVANSDPVAGVMSLGDAS